MREARELHQEKEDAKEADIVRKAKDKVRRQLAKEDKQRINEMTKASKATKQKHKEDAEQEKKRLIDEARFVQEFNTQLKAERRLMQEKQKVKQVVFTIPEEASIEEECEVEDGVVKPASSRPQRMRNPPKWHGDSVITIE